MKTIQKSITLIAIVLIAFSTINCNSQINSTKQKGEQRAIEYPEAKLVQKNVGTLDEELQGELQIALGDNDIVALRRVLGEGANANKLPGNTDMTPIMLAETAESAKLLLDKGANPLMYDANGQNLLHYAVSKEHALDLIPLYVSLGVTTNARDKDDNTPLSLAIIYFEEINAFDSQGVHVGEENNQPNDTKSKPNPYEILETLVKVGADMNSFNKFGNTLLMDAVTQNNSKLVQILLELGADKAIQNPYGETAKDIAYKKGRRHIYQLLE